MRRWMIAIVLSAGFSASAASIGPNGEHYFDTPTRVNLLERWDVSTGAPAHAVSQTSGWEGSPAGSLLTWSPGLQWRHRPPSATNPLDIVMQIDLAPGTPLVGDLSFSMKDANHSADAFDLTDQNGLIMDETHPSVTFGNSYGGAGGSHYLGGSVNYPAGRDVGFLRFETSITKEIEDPVGSGNYSGTTRYAHHLSPLNVTAAAGQQIQIEDSGYNIFHDSAIKDHAINNATTSSRVSSNMVERWFDGDLSTQQKQPGINDAPADTDWIIVPFEEEWNFEAARGVLYGTRRYWQELTLEISRDGNAWTQVFYADVWQMTSDPSAGWMEFGTGDGSQAGPVTGKYVRLSWLSPNRLSGDWQPDRNAETVEMRNLELFVTAVPEPATLTLLFVGAGLMSTRKPKQR